LGACEIHFGWKANVQASRREEITRSTRGPGIDTATKPIQVDTADALHETVEEQGMRKDAHLEMIETHMDAIHPGHVHAFLKLLTELREVFQGDLDAMIVLCAISVDTDGTGWRETLLASKSLERTTVKGTNTQSIAHTTRIPRETVRRKLSAMQEKGWIFRDALGNWQPTRQSAQDLEPATRATMVYMSTLIRLVQGAEAGSSG